LFPETDVIAMKRYLLLLLFSACLLRTSAREVIPLNEGWRFFFKSENTSDRARYVTLPHSWNTDPRAAGDFLKTTGNYQNDLYIPAEWASKRIFVKFYGVQSVADLFVNGRHAGSHRGGASAFVFEITDKVRFGADNALLMVVSNADRSDVLPTSTDINLYGGIYREAELILTGPTAVSPLYLGTDGVLVRTTAADEARASGEVEVHLTSGGEGSAMLTLEIVAPDGEPVFVRRHKVRLDGKPVTLPFVIENPRLWSPARPMLHTVTVVLDDGKATDSVRVRTGFRTVAVDPAGGLRIGSEYQPVRGVSLHHDNTLSGGTLTAADYDADLAVVRDLGATAVRSAVMPHAPCFYDRCDESGLLAWVDIPFQCAFPSDIAYFSTPQFEQNGLQQLQEIVAQQINHPSVVMWGLFSHLRMRGDDVLPYLRRLNEAAHALDPTRPTVACSDQDGRINFVTDLIVWHQSVGWQRGSTDDLVLWRDQLQVNWSHLRSGICYGAAGIIGHATRAAQTAPRANWLPEERQTRFHEEYARNLHADSLFWGVWVSDLFDYGSARRPYGIDCGGLVTIDRRERKDAYYLYRALWNDRQPTLHIAGRHRILCDGERQAFCVYSSAGMPTLLVGGDTVAMSQYAACQYRSDSVAVRGCAEVRAIAGALRDSVVIRADCVVRSGRRPALRRTADLQPTD